MEVKIRIGIVIFWWFNSFDTWWKLAGGMKLHVSFIFFWCYAIFLTTVVVKLLNILFCLLAFLSLLNFLSQMTLTVNVLHCAVANVSDYGPRICINLHWKVYIHPTKCRAPTVYMSGHLTCINALSTTHNQEELHT